MRLKNMKSKNNKLIQITLILLLVEKIIQHVLTAAAFFIEIPGIGTPDIGTRFEISDPVMGVINLILGGLFTLAIWGIYTDKKWSKLLIFFLGGFDIVAEFIFHGFFFITFSVIGSAILIVLLLKYPASYFQADSSP
jgi:hypothetical protein